MKNPLLELGQGTQHQRSSHTEVHWVLPHLWSPGWELKAETKPHGQVASVPSPGPVISRIPSTPLLKEEEVVTHNLHLVLGTQELFLYFLGLQKKKLRNPPQRARGLLMVAGLISERTKYRFRFLRSSFKVLSPRPRCPWVWGILELRFYTDQNNCSHPGQSVLKRASAGHGGSCL